MPYIVLETIAAGVPMIATSVGGIPEIFGDESHRLVAARRSRSRSPTRMIGARRLRPTWRAPNAVRLKARVAALFTVEAMAAAVEDAYRAVLRVSQGAA